MFNKDLEKYQRRFRKKKFDRLVASFMKSTKMRSIFPVTLYTLLVYAKKC